MPPEDNLPVVAASWYPWWKALHVAFMVTWFAGLFYLPRLFIYHVGTSDDAGRERFNVMERRLYGIMTIGATITIVFGLLMLSSNRGLLLQSWFQAKLVLLAGLVVFHLRCRSWMLRMRRNDMPADTQWLRWFNEIPVIFLLAIICLAVVKPSFT